jgi:hypothetical protein
MVLTERPQLKGLLWGPSSPEVCLLMTGEEVLGDYEYLIRIQELRQMAATLKLKADTEWISEFFAGQDADAPRKLVVFAWHRAIVQIRGGWQLGSTELDDGTIFVRYFGHINFGGI